MRSAKVVVIRPVSAAPKLRTITLAEDIFGNGDLSSSFLGGYKSDNSPISSSNQEPRQPILFDFRASRYHGLLSFIACRVLGSREGAEAVVQRCLFTASLKPMQFDSEGAFLCWLTRILIDEALLILHENGNGPQLLWTNCLEDS